MKRISVVVAVLLLLSGCAGVDAEMERAMALRAEIQSKACEFEAVITTDYSDKTCTFTMDCQAKMDGTVEFTVTAPESIAGISGTLGAQGGKLTFEDEALAFELLADGQVTPISAPWILIHTLSGGYLKAAVQEDEALHLSIDDSYADDALYLDVWLDAQNHPTHADILWQGRRILSLQIRNFDFE